MNECLVALLVFFLLASASLGCLFVYEKLSPRHRQDDTQNVVRLVTNIFVVMTSLVLGLMINSAKNRFDVINRDVHAYATELILFDKALRLYGPEANDTRQRLLVYMRRATDGKWTSGDPLLVSDRTFEKLLNDVGSGINTIRSAGSEQIEAWNHVLTQYQRIVELRWTFLSRRRARYLNLSWQLSLHGSCWSLAVSDIGRHAIL